MNTADLTADKEVEFMFFVGDLAGCAHYRIYIPTLGLLRRGHECRVSMIINDKIEALNPKTIIASRQHKPEVLEYFVKWKSEGKKIIYDVDDDLFTLYPSNPAYKSYQNIKNEVVNVLKVCDLITVSTDPLIEVYNKINPNVKVLPNQILREYKSYYCSNNTDTIRIGWAGSNTHETDFGVAAYDLLEIVRLYPKVKLVFFGYVPDRIKDALKGTDKIEFHPFVEVNKYHRKLGSLQLDIGIAPLYDNKFNISKSNLKILEYGVMGVPTVASDIYPYTNTIEHGVNGHIVKKNKGWKRNLIPLIEDAEYRKSLGKAMQEKVLKEYEIMNNIGLWESAYKELQS